MQSEPFELKAESILKRLSQLQPGERLVFDTQFYYSAAPKYADSAERQTVLAMVNRLLSEGKGMVFHRRIVMPPPDWRVYIVREFLLVRSETLSRLNECLAGIKLPSIVNQYRNDD